MKNNSVSDFVAASMDAVLKSDQHKALFGTQYKFASSDQMCAEHGKADSCDANAPIKIDPDFGATPTKGPKTTGEYGNADDMFADDENDAKDSDKKDSEKDEEDEDKKSDKDSASADDDDNDASDPEEMSSSAFDLAIDSLLTASAALDSVGMEKSSSLSLKLASLVVEAKKKDSKDKKDKKDTASADDKAKKKAKEKAAKEKEEAAKKKAKEKAAKDTQMAKDKAAKDKEKEKAAKEKAAKEEAAKKAKEKASKK